MTGEMQQDRKVQHAAASPTGETECHKRGGPTNSGQHQRSHLQGHNLGIGEIEDADSKSLLTIALTAIHKSVDIYNGFMDYNSPPDM